MKAKVRPNSDWRAPADWLVRAGCVLLVCGATCLAQAPDAEGLPVADIIPLTVGSHPVPIEKFRALIKTRTGQPFKKVTLHEDIRALSQAMSFAKVEAWPQPTQDGKVNVYFRFQTRQSVIQEIIYKGAKHFKDRELDEITGLRKGMPMSPAVNRRAAQAIKQSYEEKGRLMSNVYLEEGDKFGDSRVVFNITEGPVVKVSKIVFEGNSFVTDARLQTQVDSSKSFLGIGGRFVPQMADNDVIKLNEYYKTFGYHDVQISRELQWDEGLRSVKLVFHIREGARYRISNVQVNGAKVVKEEELIRHVKAKPGELYNQGVVEADLESLKQYYGYRGRNSILREDVFYPHDRPGQVDVHYNVVEQDPAVVGQVFIVGNEVTRQNVIMRQLRVYPGQVLSYPDLRYSEQRLSQLNIFENDPAKGIRPTVSVLDSDSNVKDILITVQETQTGSLMFGVGVNSDAGLTGSIVLNERNFDILNPPTSFDDFLSGKAWRGGGQEFRLEAVPGTQLQRYTASWREPFLFDSQFSLGVSGYYYTRFFNEYAEDRLGGRISVGRRLNDVWTLNSSVRIENVGVHDVPFFAPATFQDVVGNNFLLGLRTGFNRDTRDSYLRPTRGSVLDISYEHVLGAFDFPIATADFNKYWTAYERPDGSGRHVLAMRNQCTVTGSQAPVYERLYAGGFRTIRGFEFRGVGPSEGGFMTGGDFMMLNSLEYQIPLRANDQLYMVAFVDSGTVESDVEILDYRVTAGMGLRIIMPMFGPVPIALDFGFPIVQKETDRERIFSFWVGFFH